MADTPLPEGQDQAEVLDETHLTRDGEDIANFDEIADVLDVTSADGDADDDDLDEEFDADGAFDEEDPDDADIPLRTRLEDRPERNLGQSIDDDAIDGTDLGGVDDVEGGVTRRDEDSVTTEDRTDPTRFESTSLSDGQLAELGYKK